MLMFLRYLVSSSIIFLLAGSASIKAESEGFVEGHLKIIFGFAVDQSDKMPRPEVGSESYAEYLLVILKQDEKKEVAQVTADENGNSTTAILPRGHATGQHSKGATTASGNCFAREITHPLASLTASCKRKPNFLRVVNSVKVTRRVLASALGISIQTLCNRYGRDVVRQVREPIFL